MVMGQVVRMYEICRRHLVYESTLSKAISDMSVISSRTSILEALEQDAGNGSTGQAPRTDQPESSSAIDCSDDDTRSGLWRLRQTGQECRGVLDSGWKIYSLCHI